MDNREVELKKIYRHFKGMYYYVKEIVIHSETLEEMVVYQQLYNEFKTFVRPLKMFLEEVDPNREGNITKQKYRFEKIDLKELEDGIHSGRV